MAGEPDQQHGDVPPALAGVEICSPNNWSVTTSLLSISASQSASSWSLSDTSTFSPIRLWPMALIPGTLFETRYLERFRCFSLGLQQSCRPVMMPLEEGHQTGPIQNYKKHNSFVKRCSLKNFAMPYLLLMATLVLKTVALPSPLVVSHVNCLVPGLAIN